MTKLTLGKTGEQIALKHLIGKGYTILDTNFRAKSGEIDIIARDRQTVVFIEVKTRRNLNYGSPLEAVDVRKQLKIRKTAMHFIAERSLICRGYRFDVISLLPAASDNWQIEHIENAF